MKFLSKKEAVQWALGNGIALDAAKVPEPTAAASKVPIPSDAGQRVALVKHAMDGFRSASRLLVWLDEWGVWSSGERMHVFDRFRLSYGEARKLIDTPAHLFDETEFEDATSFVTLAVLFLWDCYVITPRGRQTLFFSHDEYVLIKGITLPGAAEVQSD